MGDGGTHRAGIDDYLRLAAQMRDDHTLYMWAKIQDSLTEIDDHLIEPADKQAFEAWVRDLVTPLAQELGWQPKPGEEENDTSLRPLVYSVLGLIGHDDAALTEGKTLAQKYLEGRADAVDPSMTDVVLRLGASRGDKQLYDLYLSSLPKQKTAQTYRSVLDALTYFPQPELIQRTLEYSLSDQVRAQDTPLILAFWKDVHPSPEVWNFVRTNWPAVSKKVTVGYYSFVQTAPASFLCSEAGRKQAEEFFHEHHVEGADLQEQQALESIDDCATIKQQQSKRLAKFFEDQSSRAAMP
jgi:aminopeptidase N/puromycin-sensitive aminopeptidase